MTDELRECPFCGGEAEVTRVETSRTFGTTVLVGCTNPACNAFSEPMAFTKKVWNTRPAEDKLVAERDSLSVRLEKAQKAQAQLIITLLEKDELRAKIELLSAQLASAQRGV